jgi:hypothetical protein
MSPSSPSPGTSPAGVSADTRAQLEIQHLEAENAKLQLENQKLSLELNKLKSPPHWTVRAKPYVPIISTLLAVSGFWFGILQYVEAERSRRDQQQTEENKRRDAQAAAEATRLQAQERADRDRLKQQQEADVTFRLNLRRETAKPLWDKQLSLYIEAADRAATIATTDDDLVRRDAEKRFWVLYWGPLAAVEDVGLKKEDDPRIARAMVQFGNALSKDPKERDRSEMQRLALDVAHAIRKAIAPAFDVEAADLTGVREKKP